LVFGKRRRENNKRLARGKGNNMNLSTLISAEIVIVLVTLITLAAIVDRPSRPTENTELQGQQDQE
jgi:hypothetical protein